MTVEVVDQAGYVAILPEKLNVTDQAAFVAIFAGTRVSITDHAAYVALFNTAPPAGRRRRVVAVVSG